MTGYLFAIVFTIYFFVNLIPFVYNYVYHYVDTSKVYPEKTLAGLLKRMSLTLVRLTPQQRVFSGIVSFFSTVFLFSAFMAIGSNS